MNKLRFVLVVKSKEPEQKEEELILGEDEGQYKGKEENHELSYMSEPYKKKKTPNKLIPTTPTKTETSASGKKTTANKA